MPGPDHEDPTSRPAVWWWAAIVVVPLGLAALAESLAGKVVVLGVATLAAGMLYMGLRWRGRGHRTLLGAAAVVLLIAVAIVPATGNRNRPGDAPTDGFAESSQPAGQDEETASSPSLSAPSRSPRPTPVVSPVGRQSAPTATIGEASTAEFFADTPLVVGLSSSYVTFASLTLSTDFATCSTNLDPGETAVVRAGPDTGDETSVWLRVTVIKIEARSVKVRVERLLAQRPVAGEFCG